MRGLLHDIVIYTGYYPEVSVPLYAGIVTPNAMDMDGCKVKFQFPCMRGLLLSFLVFAKVSKGVSVPLYAGIVTKTEFAKRIGVDSFSSPVCGDCYLKKGLIEKYPNCFSSPVCGDCYGNICRIGNIFRCFSSPVCGDCYPDCKQR